MKKKLAFVIAVFICATAVLTSCASDTESDIEYVETTTQFDYKKFEGVELSVYNWGYYISDGSEGSVNVNEEFEKLTGIKIVYDNYDSNESMHAKLESGGSVDYDVVFPSDYMIGRLIEEGRLAELNFDNIPNYKYIDSKYKGMEYDPEDKYSVPYNVGKVGVIYNTEMVEETPDSWSLLWDERYKGKLLNFNNSRDAFAIAQFYLGLDINSDSKADWDKAYEKLVEQKDLLQAYVMDEVFNKMESGEAIAAPYYAGDFFTMYENNDKLGFYYPKEGTNVFVDAVCVLKDSKNKEAAELYINFLLDPEIAKANAEYMYYASPNIAVVEDEEYLSFLEELHPNAFEILYADVENCDSFANLSQTTKDYMSDKWTSLGAAITEESNNVGVYALCIIILVGIVVYFVIQKIIKKKREMGYN